VNPQAFFHQPDVHPGMGIVPVNGKIPEEDTFVPLSTAGKGMPLGKSACIDVEHHADE